MKYVLSTLCIMIFSMALSSLTHAENKPMPEYIEGTTRVSAEDIFDLVDTHDNLVIIDSRKPEDRAAGYIEGSLALPDFETNANTLATNVDSKNSPIVFYCNGSKCGRSMKASKVAIAEGYNNIYWFRGGWEEWTAKGYPAITD